MGIMTKLFGTYSDHQVKKLEKIAAKIEALATTYKNMTDDELRAYTDKLKDDLANGKTLDDILPEAFATIREGAWRVLGMKHYPVQIIGYILSPANRQDTPDNGRKVTAFPSTDKIPVPLFSHPGRCPVTLRDWRCSGCHTHPDCARFVPASLNSDLSLRLKASHLGEVSCEATRRGCKR